MLLYLKDFNYFGLRGWPYIAGIKVWHCSCDCNSFERFGVLGNNSWVICVLIFWIPLQKYTWNSQGGSSSKACHAFFFWIYNYVDDFLLTKYPSLFYLVPYQNKNKFLVRCHIKNRNSNTLKCFLNWNMWKSEHVKVFL